MVKVEKKGFIRTSRVNSLQIERHKLDFKLIIINTKYCNQCYPPSKSLPSNSFAENLGLVPLCEYSVPYGTPIRTSRVSAPVFF